MKRRANWMQLNEQVDVLQQQMAELETKQLTELGKKRKLNKVTRKIWLHSQERIAQLEQEVLTAQGQIEGAGPKLVGDQMALEPGVRQAQAAGAGPGPRSRSQLELPQMEQSRVG